MPTIHLETRIATTKQRAFDLSRSIDFHMDSMKATGERAVAGRMSGLIDLGEFVEWEATHFLVRQRLSSRITEMQPYRSFVDEQLKGAFKGFYHKHSFTETDGLVLVVDDFTWVSPLGLLGRLADFLFLKRYMEKLLLNRAMILKHTLESDLWKRYVKE